MLQYSLIENSLGHQIKYLFFVQLVQNTVEVVAKYLSTPCTLVLTVGQYKILELFNEQPTLTYTKVHAATGMSKDFFDKQIAALFDKDQEKSLLVRRGNTDTPLVKDEVITLNYGYTSKHAKDSFIKQTWREALAEESVKTTRGEISLEEVVKVQRKLMIQVSIIKIIKERKVIKPDTLLEEVKWRVKEFEVDKEKFEKALEELVDRDIIAKDESAYRYTPQQTINQPVKRLITITKVCRSNNSQSLKVIMEKPYCDAQELTKFSESLLDKIERVPLLIDYFATCGIKQKDLLEYISKLEETKTPVLPSLQWDVLKKNKLVPDVTSRYPPIDKPSFPFPSDIQDFCFPTGYEVLEGDQGLAKTSSFILTNETGQKTYIVQSCWMPIGINKDRLLMAYENLDEFIKGRNNTHKWKDTEERERYIRERWENSLLTSAGTESNPGKGETTSKGFAGPLNNLNLIAPCEKIGPLPSPTTISKRYRILLPSCLCIVSRYPFLKTFERILRAIYGTYNEFLDYPLEYYISCLVCTLPLPPRGFYQVNLQLGQNFKDIKIEQSLMNQLPLLDINFYLLPKHFSIENAIKILNVIMLEHNVLFVCNDVEKLTPISESIMALMFPFDYQLVYIPVLPESMLEFLNSPVPFVAGIHKKFLAEALEGVSKDTCIADIDNNTIEFKDEVAEEYVGRKDCAEIAPFPRHETEKLLNRVGENWQVQKITMKQEKDTERKRGGNRELSTKGKGCIPTGLRQHIQAIRRMYRQEEPQQRKFREIFQQKEILGFTEKGLQTLRRAIHTNTNIPALLGQEGEPTKR
eukprot:TRINITY_DN2830_c0_g1_i1.p1 TRINITY_DN2830_c0_g1~~TRINITY_DN2830_c0_g1_i1.p1  ORF type:complete len:808 (+),score=62.07 TRINITY_DN2830_c0_g1_i1:9971-12394(+)